VAPRTALPEHLTAQRHRLSVSDEAGVAVRRLPARLLAGVLERDRHDDNSGEGEASQANGAQGQANDEGC
jgi:hypothetical protein